MKQIYVHTDDERYEAVFWSDNTLGYWRCDHLINGFECVRCGGYYD